MGQSVERLTLGLSSGGDLRVVGSSPALGFTLSVEPILKPKPNKQTRSGLYTHKTRIFSQMDLGRNSVT